MPNDPINHPSHYAVSDNGIEAIDAIRGALGRELFIGFLRGTIIKYQWRLDKKGNASQDAGKADWYSKKLVEVLNENVDETANIENDILNKFKLLKEEDKGLLLEELKKECGKSE